MPDLPLVWIVLWGTENEAGEVVDAGIEHVYASRGVAEQYVAGIEKALRELGEEDSHDLRWIEEWAIQTEVYDERLGDALVDDD